MPVNVSEIFYSISGEGISQGVPTVFIRLSGCSLRCGLTDYRKLWCDTTYSLSPGVGVSLTPEDALFEAERVSDGRIVQLLITGGEPLEGDEKKEFCSVLSKLLSDKRHNSSFRYPRIETNGKESIRNLENMVFTIDYKLPGSGMESWMNKDNFYYLNERANPLDEVKFVIRDRIDYLRSLEVVKEFMLSANLLFSPVEGELDAAELAEWVKTSGLVAARLSLQLHKILWGNKRGV
jgi:7-carboxy-7-deazaguanine synthase